MNEAGPGPGILSGGPSRHRPALARTAALLCALFANPAFAQTLGRGGDDGISTWRVLATLALCLTLAVAGAFAIRAGVGRRLPFPRVRAGRRKLVLVETLRLGHQTDICILDCEGSRVLLATGPHGARLLDRLPPAAITDTVDVGHTPC